MTVKEPKREHDWMHWVLFVVIVLWLASVGYLSWALAHWLGRH